MEGGREGGREGEECELVGWLYAISSQDDFVFALAREVREGRSEGGREGGRDGAGGHVPS